MLKHHIFQSPRAATAEHVPKQETSDQEGEWPIMMLSYPDIGAFRAGWYMHPDVFLAKDCLLSIGGRHFITHQGQQFLTPVTMDSANNQFRAIPQADWPKNTEGMMGVIAETIEAIRREDEVERGTVPPSQG